MREASESRTVTDTDSYDFLLTYDYRRQGDDRGRLFTIMDCHKLASYFNHHDKLVADWLDERAYLEEPYMPEPWWGWAPGNNGHTLHAVVINLNPGKGGLLQRRKCIRCACGGRMGYREAMADHTVFPSEGIGRVAQEQTRETTARRPRI